VLGDLLSHNSKPDPVAVGVRQLAAQAVWRLRHTKRISARDRNEVDVAIRVAPRFDVTAGKTGVTFPLRRGVCECSHSLGRKRMLGHASRGLRTTANSQRHEDLDGSFERIELGVTVIPI